MNHPQQVLRSYRPGDWYAVLGSEVALLLPPAARSRVAALWELVDSGADLDEVLDAVIAPGLRDLPGFALLGGTTASARVVLRGEARALVAAGDASAEVDGRESPSWVDRTFADVTALALIAGSAEESGPDGPDGPDLLVGPGLVHAGRLDQPAVGPTGTGTGTGTGVVPVPEPRPEPEPAPRPEPEPVPQPAPAPRPPAEETPTEQVPVSDLPPPPPAPPVPGAVPPVPSVPPLDAPVAWSPVGDDLERDHDGHTHQPGYDPSGFARQQPGIPGQPPAPSITRPVARLNVSNGDVVEVDRVVLVGRAPEARRFTATDQPRMITVPSPHQEISSTHLEIRPGSGADHGSAVVTDLGSTNGTILVQPGLPPEPLQAGIPVQLIPGAVIDLGDGVTIQVTNP